MQAHCLQIARQAEMISTHKCRVAQIFVHTWLRKLCGSDKYSLHDKFRVYSVRMHVIARSRDSI